MPIAPLPQLISFAAPARHRVAGSEIRSLFDPVWL
jgi:hypothetical protein